MRNRTIPFTALILIAFLIVILPAHSLQNEITAIILCVILVGCSDSDVNPDLAPNRMLLSLNTIRCDFLCFRGSCREALFVKKRGENFEQKRGENEF